MPWAIPGLTWLASARTQIITDPAGQIKIERAAWATTPGSWAGLLAREHFVREFDS